MADMLPHDDRNAGASDDEPFLTVKQVAQRLNVSPSIVYQLLDSGRLSCHRIGKGRGTIRINESDLEMTNSPQQAVQHIKDMLKV